MIVFSYLLLKPNKIKLYITIKDLNIVSKTFTINLSAFITKCVFVNVLIKAKKRNNFKIKNIYWIKIQIIIITQIIMHHLNQFSDLFLIKFVNQLYF